MLSFDDCVGLSQLTTEEIAAIARHEHLPEIAALEMGWSLCGSPEGEQLIRRMILEDIEDARRRGEAQEAATLRLVLRHFEETHPDRQPQRHLVPDGTRDASSDAQEDSGRLAHMLGLDTTTAPWLRERVAAYLTAMLCHFGLERASVEERFPSEMAVAEERCALCTETGRCRRFLADIVGADTSSTFCPNAPFFEELRRHDMRSRRDHDAERSAADLS
jgi:Family of unknown function (DUF6455)